MKHKSKADVGDINMESQWTVSPFEAVPSPESQSVVFFPGLASSPLEGQEARTSSRSQEIMSSPLESQGTVSPLGSSAFPGEPECCLLSWTCVFSFRRPGSQDFFNGLGNRVLSSGEPGSCVLSS